MSNFEIPTHFGAYDLIRQARAYYLETRKIVLLSPRLLGVVDSKDEHEIALITCTVKMRSAHVRTN
jgi:hypothetical protein